MVAIHLTHPTNASTAHQLLLPVPSSEVNLLFVPVDVQLVPQFLPVLYANQDMLFKPINVYLVILLVKLAHLPVLQLVLLALQVSVFQQEHAFNVLTLIVLTANKTINSASSANLDTPLSVEFVQPALEIA